MALVTQTGNTYTSESVKDIIKIQTANLGFSTPTTSSKKVSESDCTDGRSDNCILCPFHIQEKSLNGSAQLKTEISNDAKTKSRTYFYPHAQYEG